MASIFDVKKQLVFYGAYHSNKTNVRIHMVGVPLLIWTFEVMLTSLPWPSFFPQYRYDINSVLSFELNWATVQAAVYLLYYYILLPSAAVTYTPQAIVSLLTATAVGHDMNNVKLAFYLHIASWIAQFYGHGVHEGRAPALLDNLLGAVVLAPFFVHLEVLFNFGYFRDFHKDINNKIGVEIAKFRTQEAAKKKKAT